MTEDSYVNNHLTKHCFSELLSVLALLKARSYIPKNLVFTQRVLHMLIDKIRNRKSGINLFELKGFCYRLHPTLPYLAV